MEDYIQFSAKTKSEAITKACIELGVSSDQLEIQVISEGSNGFFGIGSKPAVIKVRKIELVSEEEEMKEIVETVKLDSFKEETPVEEKKPEPVKPVKPAKPVAIITVLERHSAMSVKEIMRELQLTPLAATSGMRELMKEGRVARVI